MPTIVQFRRGTGPQNDTFTGSSGEITFDTTLNTLRIHDGSTLGGHKLVQANAAQSLSNKNLVSPTITGDIVPTANEQYDLGSSTQRWRSLYVSGNTIYVGEGSISIQDSTLVVAVGENEVTVPIASDESFATLNGAETLGNKTLLTPSITDAISTTSLSFDLLNSTATSINFAGAATQLSIGAATGTTTVNNDLVVDGTVSHSGLVPTAGTNIDQIKEFTKSLTIGTEWSDVGIKYTDLQTGTYIVQVYANDIASGGANANEYYSGTMSWYAGGTSSTSEMPTDEIVLHRAGGSGEGNIYLRTYKSDSSSPDRLKLQIYSNHQTTSSSNYVFRFRRMI